MREIKFRGWHSKAKVMFSAEQMAADQLTLLPTGSFINVSGSHVNNSVIYPPDKFIPLQFTGLQDKDGVEIYESDLVRFTDILEAPIERNPITAVVVFYEERAQFIPQEPEQNHKGGNYIHHWDYCLELEVIGNIYENPELMK